MHRNSREEPFDLLLRQALQQETTEKQQEEQRALTRDKQPAESRAAAPRAVSEHLAVVFAGSAARAFAGVVCVGDLPAG